MPLPGGNTKTELFDLIPAQRVIFGVFEVRRVTLREVVVAVTDGNLDFGTWEQIFYGEFDGRRKKRMLVKIIGE